MTLLAFGINHTTAPLAIRERVAFAPEILTDTLVQARESLGAQELAILFTCNRTEVYVDSKTDLPQLLDWLVRSTRISSEDLENCYYALREDDAVRHMMKVAGGLDSLILGEPQILGQMKSAYQMASQAGTVGVKLHSAFQHVFTVAKQVRSQTGIGENPVSVAYTAVSLAQQIFSDLKRDTALLIGAGETIELVARHLSEQGIHRMIVANRTLDRALQLASRFDAEAVLLADIPQCLHRADIVISSTASQLPLLGKGAVESALKKRRHKPMFMLDIAVPRDIEPEVGELADVYLYTVDDLQAVIDKNRKSREAAATRALDIIEVGVEDFRRQLRISDAADTIKAYRQKADILRAQELERALRMLDKGEAPAEVLAQLARSLTNKLLHAPTTALRDASASGRGDIVRLAHHLFALTEDDIDKSEPR